MKVEKTKIFFSENINWHIKEDLTAKIGFQCTLGKYLGVPIFHKKVKKESFEFLLDKVNHILSGWKSKMLSMAGRLSLAKYVIKAFPSYVMQIVKIPAYICGEIYKNVEHFYLGDDENRRRVHIVAWSELCMPKNAGGLGLRSSTDMNKSLVYEGWLASLHTKELSIDFSHLVKI
ncbi:hypothetical protein AAZX31_09G033400 [Glycine max]